MASGHVNRTQRPNTWLHRPACDVKISLPTWSRPHMTHHITSDSALRRYFRNWVSAQQVDATQTLNLSAGDSNSKSYVAVGNFLDQTGFRK